MSFEVDDQSMLNQLNTTGKNVLDVSRESIVMNNESALHNTLA